MTYNCTAFRCITTEINATDNVLKQVFSAGDMTFVCTLVFDTDKASDTYDHWVCIMNIVSDTEDIPERSFTLYPNTVLFIGDDRYIVSIQCNKETIGHDDLLDTYLIIGVPVR